MRRIASGSKTGAIGSGATPSRSVESAPAPAIGFAGDPKIRGSDYCIRDSAHSNIARLLGGATNPLAAAFAARNATSSPVPQLTEGIRLVSPDQIEAIFRTGGRWEEFRGRFGKAGLVQVSAPAIQGEQAAVYVIFGCGGLCGKSWLVTLERRRGEFRVKQARIMTIS